MEFAEVTTSMKFASAISAASDASAAFGEALGKVTARVPAAETHLALFFATAHFEEELDALVEKLADALPDAVLIGATAEGVIGGSSELERRPGLSLLTARLPGVDIRPFVLTQAQIAAAASPAAWESLVGASRESQPVFVALADPFSIDVHRCVEGLNESFPGAPLFGGLASAAERPGQNRLIFGRSLLEEGAVGVALSGDLHVEGVVSQGCRPIGRPFVVTRAERNVVLELGGRPSLAQLRDVYESLEPRDEKLAGEALFVGRVIDEYKRSFQRGDFLIHNIRGADRESGAIAIAGLARVGSTVQFHVRDAVSADEDLRQLLAAHAPAAGATPVAGAMLFGCNGRGLRMWNQPHHDIRVLHEIVGDVPAAGFFCAGEFGPVGGRNFIHGFTASIALFKKRETGGLPGD